MARGGAQLERPVRPGEHLVFAQRRLRQDLEIGHRQRALPDRGADAIGAGIAAADDDDVLAAGEDRLARRRRLAADAPVLLRQEIHGEVDAIELAAGNGQVARLLGAAGQDDCIIVGNELVGGDVDADMRAVVEHHALGLHLRDAAVDVMLFHLEVGNAVAKEAAGLGEFLENVGLMSGAGKLLRAGEARRSRADDRDLLSAPLRRRLRLEPLRDGAVSDRAFDRFDGDRVLVDVERA